jgi:hypothetical protein
MIGKILQVFGIIFVITLWFHAPLVISLVVDAWQKIQDLYNTYQPIIMEILNAR